MELFIIHCETSVFWKKFLLMRDKCDPVVQVLSEITYKWWHSIDHVYVLHLKVAKSINKHTWEKWNLYNVSKIIKIWNQILWWKTTHIWEKIIIINTEMSNPWLKWTQASGFNTWNIGHSTSIQQISEKSVALSIMKFCTTLYAKHVVRSVSMCILRVFCVLALKYTYFLITVCCIEITAT
jgi:hypothetical protein